MTRKLLGRAPFCKGFTRIRADMVLFGLLEMLLEILLVGRVDPDRPPPAVTLSGPRGIFTEVIPADLVELEVAA